MRFKPQQRNNNTRHVTQTKPEKEVRKRRMTTGEAGLVDITAEFRRETEGGAYMVWVGDYQHHPQHGRQEQWVSLPMKLTEWDGETTFTIPLWLGREKGLI